jgi:hypothetical protein
MVRNVSTTGSQYLIEYMPGLLEHLQASGQRTISVEFITYSDYRGRCKGFSVMKIGGMSYRPDSRYYGHAGEDGAPPLATRRHPFDVFE